MKDSHALAGLAAWVAGFSCTYVLTGNLAAATIIALGAMIGMQIYLRHEDEKGD